MAELGDVIIEVDAVKTRAIYDSIERGGAKECGCSYCRNFLAQVPDCFPHEVIEFMNQCGIDPTKDAEVYEMGEVENGAYLYGGEYYFISRSSPNVDASNLNNGFEFTILNPTPLEPNQFHNIDGSKCFSFIWSIPWVLNESP